MEKFFAKDPEIQWSKVMCPICGEPSGPKSKCYEIPKEEQKELVLSKKGRNVQLNTYNPSCNFRLENMWIGTLNYPFSLKLLENLSKIKGLEKIVPLKQYTFQISIGLLFDEQQVKSEINRTYRALIKEQQARERSIDESSKKVSLIVEFPNGEKVSFSDIEVPQQSVIEAMSKKIPGIKISECSENSES